ncbi:MAG: hypothetical protein PHG00_10910 [Methylococcales bacterium]|nr:hypothetical protein [Methylococcales bacterium]
MPVGFIFDDKIAKYITEIKDKAIDLKTYTTELEDTTLPKDERDEKIEKRSELQKCLYKQINEEELTYNLGYVLI